MCPECVAFLRKTMRVRETHQYCYLSHSQVGIGKNLPMLRCRQYLLSLSPLRVIVHAAHAWKCTKDAQIRVGRSEDSEHKTLSVSLCWDSSTYRNWGRILEMCDNYRMR